MESKWFILRNGSVCGPYSLDEMNVFVISGELRPDDQIAQAGEAWTIARNALDYFDWESPGVLPPFVPLEPDSDEPDPSTESDRAKSNRNAGQQSHQMAPIQPTAIIPIIAPVVRRPIHATETRGIWRRYQRAILIGSGFLLAAAALGMACFRQGQADARSEQGEWKPSGDGYTIVNTKTGELRYSRTGESVEQVRRQREIESERQRERQRVETEQAQAWLLRHQKLEAETKRREAEETHRVYKHNCEVYARLKLFVDSHPKIDVGTFPSHWEDVTRPFRVNSISKLERDRVLDFLGLAIKRDMYRNNYFILEAMNDLSRLELPNYPYSFEYRESE